MLLYYGLPDGVRQPNESKIRAQINVWFTALGAPASVAANGMGLDFVIRDFFWSKYFYCLCSMATMVEAIFGSLSGLWKTVFSCMGVGDAMFPAMPLPRLR